MSEYTNLVIQFMLIVVLVIVVTRLLLLKKATAKEKRIARFTTVSLKDKPVSFFDKINDKIFKLIINLSKVLSKSSVMKKYSNHYEKYIDQSEILRDRQMDYISIKFLVAFFAIIITAISDVLRLQIISFPQLVFALLIGFFTPDIVWYIRNIKRRKMIEEDLQRAVIIMNNAFKSGRSIMQAVELVKDELTGPISSEFEKIHIDLAYGLELEVVFKRFSQRVNLEEVKYLTSSLVILNKTGGDILNVFSSIERSFLDRKKLRDELKSITSLSELVFRMLVLIPFIIFIVIYIMNNNYFTPLVTTGVGRIMLALIILIYVLYILIVRKIMKFKEW